MKQYFVLQVYCRYVKGGIGGVLGKSFRDVSQNGTMNGTSGNDLGGSILVTYFVKIAFIIKTDSFLLSYFSKVFPTFLNLNFFFY